MAVLYNYTNLTNNNSNLLTVFETVNNWSNGTFTGIVLFLSFVITYTWISQYNKAEDAFLTSSIIMFVLAMLFRLISFTTTWMMVLTGLIIALAAVNQFGKTEK